MSQEKFETKRENEFEELEGEQEASNQRPRVAGFQRKNYRNAKEFAKLTGISEVDEMPEDVHYYIKDQFAFLRNKGIDLVCRLYRIEKGPNESKERLTYIATMDHLPQEEEVAALGGPGSYRWKAKWETSTGEAGILSEPIFISHLATGGVPGPSQSPTPAPMATPPTPAVNHAFESLEMLERLSSIVARLNGGGQNAQMEKVFDKMGNFMQQSMEREFKSAARWRGLLQEQLEPEREEENLGGESVMPQNINDIPGPPWLQQLMPFVQPLFDRLLGGGVGAQMAKEIVFSSAQFQEIFSDESKWTMAIDAIAQKYGPEKTEKALKILTAEKSSAKK